MPLRSNHLRFENLSKLGVKSCSMFAIYDGHGGAECCNFLKENLHNQLLTSYNLTDTRSSIKNAFHKLDSDFFKKARGTYNCDTSGSCAIVFLVVGIAT